MLRCLAALSKCESQNTREQVSRYVAFKFELFVVVKPVNQSINQSINQSVSQSVGQSTKQICSMLFTFDFLY